MPVAAWVKSMTEEVLGAAPFKIGDKVKHPSGRTVQITGGAYWGEHGLSNFWYWKEILPKGKFGKEEHGYGWENK